MKKRLSSVFTLLICLSIMITSTCASHAIPSIEINIDHLFESALVANPNHLEHYFANGIYTTNPEKDALKIETIKGEKYIYFKVWLQMLESYEIHNKWQIVTDKTQTKYQLVSWKGLSQGGGWSSLDEIKTKITFNLGDNQALKDGVKVTLSQAPLKRNGRVYLPLNALEALFGYSVFCKERFLIIGEQNLEYLTPQDLDKFNKISTYLSKPPQKTPENKSLYSFRQVDDKTLIYLTETQGKCQLWLKKENKTAKEIKMPPSTQFRPLLNLIDEKKLYYIAPLGKDFYLYAFDTSSEKHLPLANLTLLLKWKPSKTLGVALNGISSHKSKSGDELIFSLQSEEITLGSNTLYTLKNGKLTTLHQNKRIFGFKPFSKGLVLIDSQSPYGDLNGLRIIREPGTPSQKIEDPKWSFQELFLENEACYVTATPYPNAAKEKPSLFKLDLNTGDLKKLTPSQDGFWALDKIYYLDAQTHYLKAVDLYGEKEETLLSAPIGTLEIQNNQCYYTLETGVSGVYKLDLKKRTNVKISDAKIHHLYINKNMIGGISEGYDPGFYLVKDGKTQQVLSGYFETLVSWGNRILYVPLNSNTLKSQSF